MNIALAQISGTPDVEANQRVAARLVADAASQNADLILFPEMSILEFFPRIPHRYEFFDLAEPIPGPTLEWFQELARENSIHIVYNHFERSPTGVFYDTSVVVDRTGTYRGRQRMMHIAEEPGYNEKFYYAPGADKYRVFELEGWHFGIAICYDRHFPEVFRSFIVQGARLILIPTAVAAQEPFAEVYSIEARAAAVTHGVYIAMVNRAGVEDPLTFLGNSMLIDPYGRIEASLDDEPNALLTCHLANERIIEARTRFPFLRDRRPETYDWLTRSPSDAEPDGDARRSH